MKKQNIYTFVSKIACFTYPYEINISFVFHSIKKIFLHLPPSPFFKNNLFYFKIKLEKSYL
ncbi:MAG: hypothetical protein D6799_08195 [Bacteroidetes bacterium]|nr:MAG: hypothetical protein D6799_08195 [Bacteroidota bacterium]